MEYIIIAATALFASALTLFSGFGLGTILLPAFILFFPIDTAIAMTAIVHLLNNIFKFYLVGRFVNKEVVIKFGIPAFLSALLGAWLLLSFSGMNPIFQFSLGPTLLQVRPVNLVIGVLIIFFAVFEFIPRYNNLAMDKKWLPFGGILSGFFGGLSGHQGALRSAFLLKCGLSKESFIATGITIACIIDISRLFIYSSKFRMEIYAGNISIILTALLAAFTGAFIGSRLMNKVTIEGIRVLVGILLIAIAALLIFGII